MRRPRLADGCLGLDARPDCLGGAADGVIGRGHGVDGNGGELPAFEDGVAVAGREGCDIEGRALGQSWP